MEATSKTILFLVVGIVVGAAVGVGAGYMIWDEDDNNDAEYGFYLYFDAGDDRNGWYTASATNTNDAFDKAMKEAGFEYEVSTAGYISSIDNENNGSGWYLCSYIYESRSETAQAASILYPYVSYDVLAYSNGWKSFSGYDAPAGTSKLSQCLSNYYFFTPYAADWSAESPCTVTDWMNEGPFAY